MLLPCVEMVFEDYGILRYSRFLVMPLVLLFSQVNLASACVSISPSKIEGVRGSMTDSKNCEFSIFIELTLIQVKCDVDHGVDILNIN